MIALFASAIEIPIWSLVAAEWICVHVLPRFFVLNRRLLRSKKKPTLSPRSGVSSKVIGKDSDKGRASLEGTQPAS